MQPLFWRFRWLRWPFLALNSGIALAAVPIGGAINLRRQHKTALPTQPTGNVRIA